METLKRCEVGDVVLWTDADTYPIADLTPLYDIAERDGIMLFEASAWWNYQWTKRDCFIVMDCDEPKYHQARHGCARFALFRKGSALAEQFLIERQAYCLNLRANTLEPSVIAPELPGFREHRSDQSILTNLAYKYGIRLYREACQAGDGYQHDRDLFPTVFHQADDWARAITAPVEGSKWRNV